MNITGTFVKIKRTLDVAPNDGVHRCDGRGRISGAKAHMVDGLIVPHGMTCFLYNDIKVFYSLKSRRVATKNEVNRVLRNQQQLFQYGLALPANGLVDVTIDAIYEDRVLKAKCFGYSTSVIPVTDKLIDYFRGKKYRWEGEDNPKAFLAFIDKATDVIKRHMKHTNLCRDRYLKDLRRIGNVLWHPSHNHYYIVDAG